MVNLTEIGDEADQNDAARSAYRSLYIFGIADVRDFDSFKQLEMRAQEHMNKDLKVLTIEPSDLHLDYFSAAHYDCMRIFSHAMKTAKTTEGAAFDFPKNLELYMKKYIAGKTFTCKC